MGFLENGNLGRQSTCGYFLILAAFITINQLNSMDNIVVEAYAVSCILPLLAFILLAFQFYYQSFPNRTYNSLPVHHPEEFPCLMGGLISITSDIGKRQDQSTKAVKEISHIQMTNYESEAHQNKYLYVFGRQAFELGRYVLNGCNAGLGKMMYMNKLYSMTRKSPESSKYSKDCKRKKSSVCSRDWFQPTRLVTIVQGLQY